MSSITVPRRALVEHTKQFFRLEQGGDRKFILVLSFVIGVLIAFAAALLKWMIEHIAHILTHSFDESKSQLLYLLYPVVGIFLSGLFIKYIVRDDIGHGITRILYAISRRQGHIKKHNTWSSIIASSITIGFGGSVGAESPIVLTGSAIGSYLGSLFKLDHRTLMLLVGCGASGAISGIFKAPIAGLVFSLEVLMLDLTMASLLPLLISCITAASVTYILSGMESEFQFALEIPFSVELIPTSIALGIFCGIVSIYFTVAMSSFENVFRKYNNMFVKLLIGGSVLSLLIYLFPPLYGQGYDSIELLIGPHSTSNGWDSFMNNSFFYGHPEYLLLFMGFVILAKVFATTATTGGGGCGGTFAPSLFLGCVSGAFFARFINSYNMGIQLPEKNYALLGMAGIMSGVMHAPLTGVFLIAEMTSGYSLFLPLMIVSISAYLTTISVEPHSIYTKRLAKKGELLTHNTDKSILTLMTLETIIDKIHPRLHPDTTLGRMVTIFSKENAEVFAVVDANNRLIGLIDLKKIRNVIFRSELYHYYTAEQLMQPAQILLYDSDTMPEVMDKFEKTNAEVLPVVTADKVFVGFVSKTHLYSMYRKILVDFSQE